jgi:hypothetical protein
VKLQHSLASILVAQLLEDDSTDQAAAEMFQAWVVQRGGSGMDLGTLKAWLRHFYPEKLANAPAIMGLVSQTARQHRAA